MPSLIEDSTGRCLAILRDVGVRRCSLRGAGCNLRGAGCEMVKFNFRTSNLSVRPLFCSRCHDSLIQKCLFHVCSVIFRELTPDKGP